MTHAQNWKNEDQNGVFGWIFTKNMKNIVKTQKPNQSYKLDYIKSKAYRDRTWKIKI